MPTDEWIREWSNETASVLEPHIAQGSGSVVADAIAGAMSEAIARTREEERAHGLEALRRAHANIARLQAALRQAADWFDGYAVSHRVKGDDDKAARNATRALHCRQAADLEVE